jgi:hypothetical protein
MSVQCSDFSHMKHGSDAHIGRSERRSRCKKAQVRSARRRSKMSEQCSDDSHVQKV